MVVSSQYCLTIVLSSFSSQIFAGGNDLVGGDSGERYGLDALSEVLGGGRIVSSDGHIGVGSALKLLEQSIKFSVSDSFDCDNLAFPNTFHAKHCLNLLQYHQIGGDDFQTLMEGGECRGGLSNVLDDADELHVDALRSGSESDEEV